MIQLLLVDDHEMVRLGLSAYFSLQDDIEVIGEASNGQEGYEQALALRPDVILMDLLMDHMDGIESTQLILSEWPTAKIIILTSFLDDEKVFPAMEAGASGYLLKTSTASTIADAIRTVYAGEKVVEEEIQEKISTQKESKTPLLYEELTAREREVLMLISKGYSNKEIADELFITLKTVKTHVSNILMKLDVSDRTQAAIYTFKHGIMK